VRGEEEISAVLEAKPTNNTTYGRTLGSIKTIATPAEIFSTILMLWCFVYILDFYA